MSFQRFCKQMTEADEFPFCAHRPDPHFTLILVFVVFVIATPAHNTRNSRSKKRMFKFNFSSADGDTSETPVENVDDVGLIEAVGVEILLTDQHRARAGKYQSSDKIESYSPLTSSYKFNLVDVRHVEHILEESDHENFKNLTDALELKSDVVKGIYEGIYLHHLYYHSIHPTFIYM